MVKRVGTGSAGEEGKRPKGNDVKDDSQSPPPMDDELMRSLQVSRPSCSRETEEGLSAVLGCTAHFF